MYSSHGIKLYCFCSRQTLSKQLGYCVHVWSNVLGQWATQIVVLITLRVLKVLFLCCWSNICEDNQWDALVLMPSSITQIYNSKVLINTVCHNKQAALSQTTIQYEILLFAFYVIGFYSSPCILCNRLLLLAW